MRLRKEVVGLFLVGRLSNQPIFLFIIKVALKRRVFEHSLPRIIIEVRKVIGRSGNGSEPIIEDDVKLRSDIAGLRVENKRDRAGVVVGESETDGASRSRSPVQQFLSVRDHFVKDVDWISPNVVVH